MSELEKILQNYIKLFLLPLIEKAVNKAVKQAFSEINQPSSDTDKKYLDAKESAAYIGDELSTFYKRIHKKEIPRHGPAGRIFCKQSDLDAFISQKQSKSIEQLHAEVDEFLKSK